MASYPRLQEEIAAGLVELPVVLIDGQVAMSGRISSLALLGKLAKALPGRGR